MNPPFRSARRHGAVAVVTGSLILASCSGSDENSNSTSTPDVIELIDTTVPRAQSSDVPVSSDAPANSDAPVATIVSRAEAEAAALAAVGDGQVTWVGREDDRGAAWEVEITRPDGSEVDVLIAADGSVID